MENNIQDQIDHYQNKLAFEMDAWDLNEAQKSDANVVVLDARSVESFDQERITNALSFPHKLMVEENVTDLDRAKLYVVYCDGIGCNASTAAALKMTQLGFNTRELIGGLRWWKEAGYPLHYGSLEAKESYVACGCG